MCNSTRRWGGVGEPRPQVGHLAVMCYVLGVPSGKGLITWRTLLALRWEKSVECALDGRRPTVLRCNDNVGGLGGKVRRRRTRLQDCHQDADRCHRTILGSACGVCPLTGW